MDRKVILLLIPNLDFGGAQRVFYNLSIELSKQYKVVECVFNLDTGHAFKSGNEVVSLDVKAGNSIIEKIYNFYLRCRRLSALKKKMNAAVCISHLEGADYVNIVSRRNEKVICCIHGSKLHDENIDGIVGWIRKMILIPILYRRADTIVTVSKGILEELREYFNLPEKKMQWIPNFFYPDFISSKSKESIPPQWVPLFNSSDPKFITIGRLTIQKNQEAFVRLASEFIKLQKSKWIIVGDGERLEILCALAKELNLRVYLPNENTNNIADFDIYFLGFHDNPYSLVSRSDWFVLTSSWEGFPMVIGESMACGTPVISTDCPTGPREFLTNQHEELNSLVNCVGAEYGILVPLLDSNSMNTKLAEWTKQLVTLTSTQQQREVYSKQGYARVQELSAPKIMERWYTVINN